MDDSDKFILSDSIIFISIRPLIKLNTSFVPLKIKLTSSVGLTSGSLS